MTRQLIFTAFIPEYNDVVVFSVEDLAAGVIDNDVLLVKSNLGETPVIVESIRAEVGELEE